MGTRCRASGVAFVSALGLLAGTALGSAGCLQAPVSDDERARPNAAGSDQDGRSQSQPDRGDTPVAGRTRAATPSIDALQLPELEGAEEATRLSAAEPGVATQVPAAELEQDALLADLRLIAETKGWTLSEAYQRHEAIEAVEGLAARLIQERPGTYVGSWAPTTPHEPATLLVKGVADEWLHDLVAAQPQPIRIVDRRPYSFEELKARQRVVHEAIAQLGYRRVGTRLDPQLAGEIQVSVGRQQGLPSRPEELFAHLPLELREQTGIDFLDPSRFGEQRVFGGMPLFNFVKPEQACTTGFSVEIPNPAYGIDVGFLTAAHCLWVSEIRALADISVQPPQQYSAYWIPWVSHEGPYGDFAVMYAETPHEPRFYVSETQTRWVTGVRTWPVSIGRDVCFFSTKQATQDNNYARRCVDVLSPSTTCTNDQGVLLGNMVEMDEAVTIVGDSGGPWHYGTRAYGIHFGRCPDNSAYTPMNSIQDWYPNIEVMEY